MIYFPRILKYQISWRSWQSPFTISRTRQKNGTLQIY